MAVSNEILYFWFLKIEHNAAYLKQQGRLWFGRSEETDQTIQSRFGAWVEKALEGGLEEWEHLPKSRLALMILADQFTRNIYRDTPKAFAGDPLARRLCLEGIKKGHDKRLDPIERIFFYLPLEHSENIDEQNQSVQLYRDLVEDAPSQLKDNFESYLDYAIRHQEIVAKWGRFPHRNRILGRESTPEELAFLKQPGSSF